MERMALGAVKSYPLVSMQTPWAPCKSAFGVSPGISPDPPSGSNGGKHDA
jgi:hypothetical protein